MEVYSSEEQQVEAIKRFWREYGITIVAGAIIGLGGLYGFRYYQSSQLAQAEQASTSFEQLLQAKENQQDNWLSDAEQYMAAHERTSYAQFAAMLKARDAVMKGDYEVAEQQLSWVIAQSNDTVIKTIARLRLARVLLQQDQATKALAVLDTPVPASFAAQQQELIGDIQLALGDSAAAKRAYVQARNSDTTEGNQLLKIKLDELAHVHVEGNL